MASIVLKAAGKRLINRRSKGESKKSNEPDNPLMLFDFKNPKYDSKGNPTWKKKLKDKDYFLSIGIPEQDAIQLARIMRRAKLLDSWVDMGGKGIGLSSFIGFIPVFGDTIDGLMALSIVRSSHKVSNGLDPGIRNKMMMNIILDVLIGLTPVLGDIVDIFFRANTKNAILLEDMLKKRVKKAMAEAEKTGRYESRNNRYEEDDTQLPRVPMKPDAHGGSPHGIDRRQYVAPDAKGSKNGGWRSGFGGQGVRKRSAHGVEGIAPGHSTGHVDPKGGGSRFINISDL